MTTTSDPYKVLGLPPGAGHEAVQAAFRALARELHPDVQPTADPEAFRALVAARDWLLAHTDPDGSSTSVDQETAEPWADPPTDSTSSTGTGTGSAWSAQPPRDGTTFAEHQQQRWARDRAQAAAEAASEAAERAAQRAEQDAMAGAPGRGARGRLSTPGAWLVRPGLAALGVLTWLAFIAFDAYASRAGAAPFIIAGAVVVVLSVWTAAGRIDRIPEGWPRPGRRRKDPEQ